MKRVFLILALALLPIAVHGQAANLRLVTSVGASSTSYEVPIVGFGVDGSFDIGRTLLDVRSRYSFARKEPGGGHNVNAQAALRIPFRGSFIGPAVGFSRQTTSIYSKSATQVGAQIGRYRKPVILAFTFLQDLTSVNRGRVYNFSMEWYRKPARRFSPYVGSNVALQDFRCHETGHGPVDHCFGTSGSISVGVLIWHRRSE